MKTSVIVPVYNEVATVGTLLERLAIQCSFHDLEVVVVESNSLDGSREVVQEMAKIHNFKLILEDVPRGKGAAVAVGLQAASGEILLIQDADLEYDVSDYQKLLEPLLSDRFDVVLGSRHSSGSRIRKMHGERFNTFITNLGHQLFARLFNAVYGTNFRDPFTMFKVFKVSALSSYNFKCRRFDFDIELLAKLVLSGNRIAEIPVSYTSRGFKQGKKVRRVRDPFTWMRAIFRFRSWQPSN
jgi:glycosyltransferase involved in cell wall biosynthesis